MTQNRWFKLEKLQGEPIQAGNARVTPFSRRLSLGWPVWLSASKGFAFIYQKPAAVRIEQDGKVSEIPVRDYQNMIIVFFMLISVVFVTIALFSSRKEKTDD